MDGTMSPADVAAVTGNNGNDMFGGSWAGIILFALIFGWGRGGLGANGGQALTESSFCNGMNFNNMESAIGRLSDTQQMQFTQLTNGMCSASYENLRNILALDQHISSCCCDTQRAIDRVEYNSAMNTANINNNLTAKIQEIKDIICNNRYSDLQNKYNELYLTNALSGVVRYPSGYTYSAGASPFCQQPQSSSCCGGNSGVFNI